MEEIEITSEQEKTVEQEMEITLEQENAKEQKIELMSEGGYGGESIKEVHIGTSEPTDESSVIWVDPSGEADKIPTKVSELENDKNYINSIPSEYITETELNEKGYLTEHQDLSEYATKKELPTKVSELENDSGFITDIPDVPTKTSQLENDSGFLEYIGVFYDWTELDSYEFKGDNLFVFRLSGVFSAYMGNCIGQYSGFKVGGNYIYKYIECYNLTTQQSLSVDMLNKKVIVKQMNIQDTNDYFANTGLDDILQEIGGQLNGIEELLGGI